MHEILNWASTNRSWLILALSILVPIVVSEIGECSTYICRRFIGAAALILGLVTTPEVGQRHKELWLDALLQRPGKLIKLAFTLFTLVEAIPRIWWVLVGEEIPAAFYRTAMQKVTGWHRARNSPKYGVELARLPGGLIAIRSRRSNPSILVFQPAEMADFLDAIKNGGYDAGSLTSDFR
jgi:hypothetical protein